MNQGVKPHISDFSPYLFWDVRKESLDLERNKRFIIQRVLDYGKINDWKLINTYYGLDQIAETATELREMDPRSLSFLIALTGLPKERFRCYTTRQLTSQHWIY